MAYTLPDLSKPITEKQYNRLKKYGINASLFVLNRFFYSKQAVIDFLTIKKQIPEEVTVIYTTKKDTPQEKAKKELRDHNIIKEIINELEESNSFKDYYHAKEKAESQIYQGKGINYITKALKEKKFTDNVIQEVVNEISTENNDIIEQKLYNNARKIVNNSTFNKKQGYEKKNYFISTLVRKGYDYNSIQQVIESNDYSHYFDTM